MMQDGKAMTEYLRDYLQVDRITLLGHSWGSYFGANLALAHPEYYEAFIGTGQFIDEEVNERRLYEAALTWSENDQEGREMVAEWARGRESETADLLSVVMLRNGIMDRYGYGMMKDGTDYSVPMAVFFNPHYSLKDVMDYVFNEEAVVTPYMDFVGSEGFKGMSLLGRYKYAMPFYNIDGDMDYQTNFELACEYFSQVQAPEKRLFVLKNATHGLLESRSDEFSAFLHEIAAFRR